MNNYDIKVHRGNLKNMIENMRNNSGSVICGSEAAKTTKKLATTEMIIDAEPFVSIKGRIRQMDDSSKLDVLKQSKNEDNFKKASNSNIKADDANEDCTVDSNKLDMDQNGPAKGCIVAPTPLPRTSRTNSMTDPSSSEESSTGSPRPSPMPRVTIGSGYKVRLARF